MRKIIGFDIQSAKKTSERRAALESLQACRGFAAIAVLLFHTTGILEQPKYWHSDPFGSLFRPGDSGVLFFFVLSGFIISHAHRNDVGRPATFTRYVTNRISRIYPSYTKSLKA
jgi:peptidoglycan/LPS O-acetylase OafA/YrhL